MSMSKQKRLVVGITGASGALYAVRTLAVLLEKGFQVDLVVSDLGRRLLKEELGDVTIDRLIDYLVSKYGPEIREGSLAVSGNKDVGARIASGSNQCDAMVIVPCSMKTMAGVAHGLSRNLIERAADVMLKERRKLIVVPRETPMSIVQLRNMLLCAEAGVFVVPAMPAFYQGPNTLDDLADFMAGKILSALDIEHNLYQPWTG